jgi:hypothetical protein
MSSPTTVGTKGRRAVEPTGLSLADSSSISISLSESESPSLYDDAERCHYKVYRALSDEKHKYVGRCWTVDAESAALKLGTRGLPRTECTATVYVANAGQPDVPAQRFEVRQFFGELSPLAEAKYSEKGKLSADGRMKYKEIVRAAAAPELKPRIPLAQPALRDASPRLPADQSKFIMVPMWTAVPEDQGYTNPWSMPMIIPSAPVVSSSATPKRSAVPRAVPYKRSVQRPPQWQLQPTQTYSSMSKTVK